MFRKLGVFFISLRHHRISIGKTGQLAIMFFLEISLVWCWYVILLVIMVKVHKQTYCSLTLFQKEKGESFNNFSFIDLQCFYAPLYLLFVVPNAILVYGAYFVPLLSLVHG